MQFSVYNQESLENFCILSKLKEAFWSKPYTCSMLEGRSGCSLHLTNMERRHAAERSQALLNVTYLLLTFLYLVVFLYDDARAAALLTCVYLLAACAYLMLALHHEDMRAAALLTALFLVFALGPMLGIFMVRRSGWRSLFALV